MNTYTFSDIFVGMEASFHRVITYEMEKSFRAISGDDNPLHKEDAYAKEISDGRFSGHIIFGMLTASLYSTIAGMYLPGKYSLIHSIEDISFMKPVFVGDELIVCGQVVDKNEDLRLIVLKVIIRNQNNCAVSRAKMKVLVMK